MRTNKSKISAVISVFVLAVLFVTLTASVYASGDTVDYTKPSDEGVKELSSSYAVEKYLSEKGEELSNTEREFLDEFGILRLKYSDIITTDKVTLDYNTASGILSVEAKEYSYTGQDGTLVWRPVSVSVGGTDVPLSGGRASFSADPAAAAEGCTVFYEASVSFTALDINTVLNLYHDTAKYIADISDYNEKLALYNDYVKAKRLYDDAKAKYEKYLLEYEQYLSDLDAYQMYEADMKSYETEYKIYIDNLAVYEAYEAELERYSRYLADMELVKKHLTAVELVKVQMTDKRSLYGAVTGGTVDQVLENESLLTGTLDADAAVIAMAGDATERVRVLMNGYYKCKTEEEKYNYYIINYENFCDSFLELTQSLDKLYRYRKVRGTLIAEGKDKKYIILVAQLALVSNALIDGEIRDYDGKVAYTDGWTIEGQTIKQILLEDYRTDTDDSKPLEGGYPAEVKKPSSPQGVAKPVLPAKPKTPIMPDAVAAPGEAPKEYPEPALPYTENEGARLAYQSMTEEQKSELEEQYRLGNTAKRSNAASDFSVTLASSVKRHLGEREYKVEFLSESGEELFSLTVERGSTAVFNGKTPEKTEDEFYSYVFVGWQNEAGESVNLLAVNSDLRLYPAFEQAPKSYSVSWIISGECVTQTLTADTLPVCPIATVKPDDGDFLYEFAGWDKPISYVNSNATYTAVFNKRHIVAYNGTGASLTDDGNTVICNAKNCYTLDTEPIDISALLDRIAGKRALIIETFRGSLHFSYTDTLKMKEEGVAAIKLDVAQSGTYKNTFSLRLLDSSGNTVDTDVCADALVACSVEDIANSNLISDREEAIAFSYGDGKIRFALSASLKYTLAPVYGISVYTSNCVRVSLSSYTPKPGDTVTLSLSFDEGYEISGIVLTNVKTGEPVELTADSFRMPEGDVEVEVTSRLKKYTVIFVSDGKVISKREYEHGAAVIAPNDPEKESDKHYSYTFSGWSPELSNTATESVRYVAKYRTARIPSSSDNGDLKLSDSVMRLLKIFIVAAVLLCTVPCLALSLCFVLRYRRLAKGSKKT